MLGPVALAVRDALAAADDAAQARSVLVRTSEGGDQAQLRADLARARALLARAERRLDRFPSSVVAQAPLLGRSWRAEELAVTAAGAVVDAGLTALGHLDDVRGPDGALDPEGVRAAGAALQAPAARAEELVRQLADAPTSLTPPLVSAGVREALAVLEPAVGGLSAAADGADVAAGLLGADGPRTVLVALGNNAELRATVGYVSTFATGTLADGRLALEPFRDLADVIDPLDSVRTVPAPADFVEDYGPYYADTTDWRMWTMTPDAPTAAAVGAQVAELLVGVRPDVVVFLDVPAVAALAALTGEPVRLPDGTAVAADDLVEALLVDTYASAGADPAEQAARRQALSAAAGATAAGLLSTDVDLTRAVQELARLGRGRHLAVWSARAQEQEQLVDLSLAGALEAPDGEAGDDLLAVHVNNLAANKLGYWTERSVRHEAVLADGAAEVVQTVRLRDTSPEGLVPYVLGIRTPGTSSLRVELSVPPTAEVEAFTVDGEPASGDLRTSSDRTRALTFVTLSRGEQVEVALRYRLPLDGDGYALRVVPQALARDAELQVAARSQSGTRLQVPDGWTRADGEVRWTGPFRVAETVQLGPDRPSGLTRLTRAVADFWRSPVPRP